MEEGKFFVCGKKPKGKGKGKGIQEERKKEEGVSFLSKRAPFFFCGSSRSDIRKHPHNQ